MKFFDLLVTITCGGDEEALPPKNSHDRQDTGKEGYWLLLFFHLYIG